MATKHSNMPIPEMSIDQLPTEKLADDVLSDVMKTEGIDIQAFAAGAKRRAETFPVIGLERFFPTIFIRIRGWDIEQSTKIQGPAARLQLKMQGNNSDDSVGDDTLSVLLQRCLVQLADYCLPVLEHDGMFRGRVVKYDPSDNGDNMVNRRVVSSLSPAMLEWLQGAMDHVAGLEDSDFVDAFMVWLDGLH
jgi:hypothetical protein